MFDLMPFGSNNTNDIFHYLDNFEKNFFSGLTNTSQFRTDILDKGDRYLLQAELPGFEKGDIKIDLNNDLLTISAEHNESEEQTDKNFIRRERRYGSFSRSFDISNIKAEEISAEYKNGILNLTLPKKQENPAPPNRRIEIQ